jgi:aspartokinase
MKNINYQVWSCIDKESAIRKDLKRGILNIRKCADFLKRRYNIDSGLDAIISAIRRYPTKDIVDQNIIYEVLKDSIISIKNGVVLFTIQRDLETLKTLTNIIKFIDIEKGEVIRFTEAKKAIKVFVDRKNMDKVKKEISKSKIIHLQKDMTEIAITFDDKIKKTVGVVASFLTTMASNNINIYESFSCFPEYMIYVDEPDALKAHEVLLNFFYGYEKKLY